MNKISLISCTMALGAVASMASADTVLTYGTAGSSYTQNFNGLANTGSSNSWSNSSSTPTLSGWNAWQRNASGSAGIRDATDTTQVSTYNANPGSNMTGGLQSYGASSSTDRALGTLNTNSTGDVGITLAIKNTTGTALNSFTFAWVLEQWRDGGNNPAVTQNMVVDYKVTAITSTTSLAEGLNYLNNIAYTTGFSTLRTATSPIASPITGAALDGNLSANRVAYTNTINSINWANNTVLVIRFWDDNHTGNDHGFGIDDVTFSAVPAPGAAALVGLAGLVTSRRRR